jgi:hypothetical protein
MAKLPGQKRILTEDFPDQKKWIPALLGPVNKFFEDITRALNKNITIAENMNGDVLTVTIDGVYPLDIAWKLTSPPVAAFIGQCREVNGAHTTFTNALFLDWEFTAAGTFRINNIAGLTASSTNRYRLIIVTFAG